MILDQYGHAIAKAPEPARADPWEGIYRFREDEMPPVKAGEWIVSQDYYRGHRVIGRFLDDGRMHIKEVQAIPDAFLAQVKYQREVWANKSKRPNTQDHWRHIGEIPQALQRQVLETDPGHFLHKDDPEAAKRMKRFWNDIDYRDLRIVEGTV